MNKKMISIRAAEIVIILGCLVGCFFITGCFTKLFGNTADVWVAGGGFLLHGFEDPSKAAAQVLTFTDTGVKMDTQSLVFLDWNDDLLSVVSAYFNLKTVTKLQQLWLPTKSGPGVQVYDVSGGIPSAPTTVLTGTKLAIAVSADLKLVNQISVYAAHSFDAQISEIDPTTKTVRKVISLHAGRRPRLIASGNSLYVISDPDVVKFDDDGEVGSTSLGTAASANDIQVGQGYVVIPSISDDKVYVFSDAWGQGNPAAVKSSPVDTSNDGSPVKVAISHTSATAYVTLFKGSEGMDAGAVDVINLATMKVTATIPVGKCPSSIAISQVPTSQKDGSGNNVYRDSSILVGNQCDSTLSRIDVATLKVVQTITLPGAPNVIATR